MAQVFGLSGRNAVDQSHKRTKRLLVYGFCAIAALSLLAGYAIGAAFPIRGFALGWALISDALLLLLVVLISKWASDKIDIMDRERMTWRKGAAGEALVAQTLAELPNEFRVVNDVSKRFGNIDHVVIGPSGVYVIDAKNWTGSVKADSQGDLLWNGKPLPKPVIKSLLVSVMDFQCKLKALTEMDYYVRGLMVFPNAYVEANYGSTGHIHCLRNNRLTNYLQTKQFHEDLHPVMSIKSNARLCSWPEWTRDSRCDRGHCFPTRKTQRSPRRNGSGWVSSWAESARVRYPPGGSYRIQFNV